MGVNFLLENCQMLNNKRLRTYPVNRSTTLVLVYRKDNRKRALRRFVEEARRYFPCEYN